MKGCCLFLAMPIVLIASFTNGATDWAVKVEGGLDQARQIAEENGYVLIGKVGELDDVYHFSTLNGYTRSFKRKMRDLQKHHKVGFFLKQKSKTLVKRNFTVPEDPLWPRQWQLHGERDDKNNNVHKAWLQGVSGEGVTVGIVDDGLQHSHPDLFRNYASDLSFDFINRDNDPTPRFSLFSIQTHGTKCAGIVGMAKDNEKCGVGVAYDSKIAGLRLLNDHGTTDLQEASALNHKLNDIDIYSNSYGPQDGGFTVDGPDYLTKLALANGVRKGRNGKGSIYVWASGNGGGDNGDSCAADGYINSIYTIAVGSADRSGDPAWYDERCSAKLVVAFNHDSTTGMHMTTTSGKTSCSSSFTGTSAACPLVSGVIALALQANPSLTWRDVQYLLVYTSNSKVLMSSPDSWFTNGAGLRVSPQFGFGGVNAEAMVTRARYWTTVPEQLITNIVDSETTDTMSIATNISSYFKTWEVNSNGDTMPIHYTNITYLEHVVITMTLRLSLDDTDTPEYDYDTYYNSLYGNYEHDVINHEYARRGDISVTLQSPQGTTSEILPNRKNDYINTEGFIEWDFMSVHFWGENPQGQWELSTMYKSGIGTVIVSDVSLKLHGTETTPYSVQQTLSSCDSDQCIGGCSTHNGRELCNTCKYKRDLDTLNCVHECAEDSEEISGYCISTSSSNHKDDQRLPYPSTTSTIPPQLNHDNEPVTVQSTATTTVWTSSIMETPIIPSNTVINTSPSVKDNEYFKGGCSTVRVSYCLLPVLTSFLAILIIFL